MAAYSSSDAPGGRPLGALALLAFLAVLAWAALLAYGLTTAGTTVSTTGQVVSPAEIDLLFTLAYADAVLVTATTVALFGGLYAHCSERAPVLAATGVVFVPIYGLLNLLASIAPVEVVPRLLDAQKIAEFRAAATLFVGSTAGAETELAVAAVSGLAYAVLAVPALAFGTVLIAEERAGYGDWPRLIAGVLLAAAAVPWLVGMGGIVAESNRLALGTTAGTVVYLAALAWLSVTFFRSSGR